MEISGQYAKQALREQVQAYVKQLTAGQREAASGQARAVLREQPEWKKAQAILLFAPSADELDVWPLLAGALSAGKVIGLALVLAGSWLGVGGRVRPSVAVEEAATVPQTRYADSEPATAARRSAGATR